jgi:hypothetical protein
LQLPPLVHGYADTFVDGVDAATAAVSSRVLTWPCRGVNCRLATKISHLKTTMSRANCAFVRALARMWQLCMRATGSPRGFRTRTTPPCLEARRVNDLLAYTRQLVDRTDQTDQTRSQAGPLDGCGSRRLQRPGIGVEIAVMSRFNWPLSISHCVRVKTLESDTQRTLIIDDEIME